jgi:3'-5' exoribonuclease
MSSAPSPPSSESETTASAAVRPPAAGVRPTVARAGQTQTQTIATLRVGDQVDAVFACSRKDRQLSRVGTPYLTVGLRDSTGSIIARNFQNADVLAGRFERGQLVRVRGRVERFRDELQVELQAITRAAAADVDPESFLPVAHRDRDELEGFLEHLAREVYDKGLSGLLERILGDRELRAQLRRAPCSIPTPPGAGGGRRAGGAGAHHAYLGGLLEHTVAVATMAVELCALHTRLDRDLLITAAIVHDLGKTREFGYGVEITRSQEGKLLGHVELGLRILARHTPATLDPERRLALEHCVITHHGPKTAGAQRFGSAEAVALYRLNALDAHIKGVFEHGVG